MSLNPTVKAKLRAWKKSTLLFATEAIPGFIPSEQQIELFKAMDSGSKRTTIRSGHGTGKDTGASICILQFLTTRAYSKVVCTAPTARQLHDILWSEISKWLRKSVLADEFVIQNDKIFHKESPKEWWARAVSTNVRASKEDQAETLAGFHGDHLFIVVDEASGVPDPVFIPLEGALTQEDNKTLLIGNMTKSSGYFYDSHFHTEIKKDWHRLHWNSEDSTNVDPSYPLYMATKYGKDSDVYRIRVEGNPPVESGNTLIPLSWGIQCVGNPIEQNPEDPLYLSVDVARYGEDSSVILPRRGPVILPWESYRGINTISLASNALKEYQTMEADGICVDVIGVGAGVVDWLERKKVPGLVEVNVAESSSDPVKFRRLRDELWWNVRENCAKARYSFPDVKPPGETESLGETLANELSSVRYEFVGSQLVVESKKSLKLRGVASPNIADALGISEDMYSLAHRIFPTKTKKQKELEDRRKFSAAYPNGRASGSLSWMAQ